VGVSTSPSLTPATPLAWQSVLKQAKGVTPSVILNTTRITHSLIVMRESNNVSCSLEDGATHEGVISGPSPAKYRGLDQPRTPPHEKGQPCGRHTTLTMRMQAVLLYHMAPPFLRACSRMSTLTRLKHDVPTASGKSLPVQRRCLRMLEIRWAAPRRLYVACGFRTASRSCTGGFTQTYGVQGCPKPADAQDFKGFPSSRASTSYL